MNTGETAHHSIEQHSTSQRHTQQCSLPSDTSPPPRLVPLPSPAPLQRSPTPSLPLRLSLRTPAPVLRQPVSHICSLHPHSSTLPRSPVLDSSVKLSYLVVSTLHLSPETLSFSRQLSSRIPYHSLSTLLHPRWQMLPSSHMNSWKLQVLMLPKFTQLMHLNPASRLSNNFTPSLTDQVSAYHSTMMVPSTTPLKK